MLISVLTVTKGMCLTTEDGEVDQYFIVSPVLLHSSAILADSNMTSVDFTEEV